MLNAKVSTNGIVAIVNKKQSVSKINSTPSEELKEENEIENSKDTTYEY